MTYWVWTVEILVESEKKDFCYLLMNFYGPSGDAKSIGKSICKRRFFKFWLLIWTPCKKVWMYVVFILLYFDVINAKMMENVKILTTNEEQAWNQPFLQILRHLYLSDKKTETTLHSYFFARNPNLQSDSKNSFKKFLTFRYP